MAKIVRMEDFKDIESLKTKLLIYPTDTVYGIGCNAENESLVARVFAVKGRDMKKPLSVIAPSKEWILAHCVVSREILDKYLPGKYTLLLKKKDPEFLAFAISGSDTVGVRIPAHCISKLIERAQIPFVTTSANKSGERSPKSLLEIPLEIKDACNIVIDGGVLEGIPSTIVDCAKENESIIKRA